MVAPKDPLSAAPGTGFERGKQNTALQGHVAFFDRDEDGIIWPMDTYVGFREIKFGVFLSIVSVLVIHLGFSYFTWGSWLPDPFFRLRVNLMHKGKHGSDSESYTKSREFDLERFNQTFEWYTSPPHTHMKFWEGVRMLHGNMNPFDPFGWSAAIFEWLATYLMLWPDDPRGIRKEDVKGVYNGSIFYKISGRKFKQ